MLVFFVCLFVCFRNSRSYFIDWLIDWLLCWVFVSVRGLSLVVASGDHSSSRCAGLSPSRPLLLRSTGSRCAGSAIVAHGPSCSMACGILPDQGSNPCPLHWQADSQPLRHQGSPLCWFLMWLLDFQFFLSLFEGIFQSIIVDRRWYLIRQKRIFLHKLYSAIPAGTSSQILMVHV